MSILKVSNLGKTYWDSSEGSHTLFSSFSYCFPNSGIVGILGSSGCGKSTLLKMIAGLNIPTSGEINVDGEKDPEGIIKKVSVVMQSPMLLPLSIIDNITMGHDYDEEKIENIIEAANLKKWTDSLPDGLNTYLGDRADELSGGQAQRIAIARAMFKDAGILLLDEPTSALDGENAASVLEAINRFTSDKTVIHVTHRREHLNGYDRIFMMKDGKLIEA